jgi:Protein of unknown function (DUF3572)
MRETINPDAEALALNALVWILADEVRSDRLLALTGLDGGSLRDRLGDREMLGAVLDFLMAHDPDLIACAQALGHSPKAFPFARESLNR